MTQLAHAKALHLLEDTGLDSDDARYVMKRLYDMGFTFRDRDHAHAGGAPPAPSGDAAPARTRRERRASYFAQMRAEVEAARLTREAELAAALGAEQERRAEEDRARDRQLAVAKVLADLPG